MNWGRSYHLDLHECNKELLKNEEFISEFLLGLCKTIYMEPMGEPIIKRFGKGLLNGVSGFLFINTSSITIHCDENEDRAFIDLFSCKDFDIEVVKEYSLKAFKASACKDKLIDR